ncbi:MAG: Peptidoglycan D,D-transpeptidase MrdA [Legionellaceae bacterium]
MHKPSTLKNTRKEIQLFANRTIVLSIFIGILILILICRLWYLQIHQHRLYMTLSQKNQLNLLPIEPNRGLIYDRNGKLIAENNPIFSLEITPSKVKSLKILIEDISKIIPISNKDKKLFLKEINQRRRFESIALRTKLTEEEVARFAVNQYRFPGVTVKARMVRYYPYRETLEPVLGYIGRINEKELDSIDQNNYSASNFIGKLGIEKYYEEELHGKVGYLQAEVDATGNVLREVNRIPPIPGKNLQLSIDLYLQQVVENAFDEEQGAAIAIDPSTGQILALVSNPAFDPNLFVDGISTKNFQLLQNNPSQPLYNRAIRGHYPPGSTIKPIMSLAGLESGIISPEDKLFDPGWFQLKNSSHIYHDWKRTGHGWVNLYTAIMESCDTYFFDLANRMGIKRIASMLHKFGFGQRTGIEMQEELPGLVPTPEWKKRIQKQTWYPGDTLITGIGQGFMLSTPLQLAMEAAIIANRGKVMKPTLIYSQQSPGFRYIKNQPVLVNTINAKSENWDAIIEGMKAVMEKGTGLAHYGKVNYPIAGKTGTAQVFSLKKNQRYNAKLLPKHLRDNSLFIAFSPIDKPQIAIAVLVEHNTEAARIARTIIDYYLFHRGEMPKIKEKPPITILDDANDED